MWCCGFSYVGVIVFLALVVMFFSCCCFSHVVLQLFHVGVIALLAWCYYFSHVGVAILLVATPLWVKCEDETHTLKSENLESSGIPENSELDCRGQNTSH